MDFKHRLKQLRLKKGLKQWAVAKVLGYRYTAISNYESGRNEPSIKDLIRLAKFFNVSVDYLIGASDLYRDFEGNSNFTWFLELYNTIPIDKQPRLQTIIYQICLFYYHQ